MGEILELTEIRISNFLSIKDELTIPILRHKDSYTTVFVGKNDSGKTNILKALSFLHEEDKTINYTDFCHRSNKNKNNIYIDIYYVFKVLNNKEILKIIKDMNIFPEKFLTSLKINTITKNLYAKNQDTKLAKLYLFEVELLESSAKFYATLNSENKVVNIEEKEPRGLGGYQLPENAKELDNKLIADYLESKIDNEFKELLPQVITWKSDERHLIFNDNPNLQLNTFIKNPNCLVPLKNMFSIAGYDETTIINAIDNALKDTDSRSELESELSSRTTEYISKIWANQSAKISVRINENGKCAIQIEDTSSRYFDMKFKSDGFKQFLSLILSLSAENSAKNLSNTLILIDEPETHLYPESTEDMKRELLKIGKNNYVFISTHSPFMIDKENSERHWKVEKNGIETSITQISGDMSMWDNKVLNSAFGLNIFKELLPKIIIVVEGNDDKQILEKLFKIAKIKGSYAIKSAGGTPHIPSLASMFCGEKIYPYFILDDDQDGRKCKNEIQKRSCYKDRVFTLKELAKKEYDKFTLEDLFPVNMVNEFFNKKREKQFVLNEQAPFLAQILNQDPKLKGNKEMLNDLKYELADKICNSITAQNIAESYPYLNELMLNIKNMLHKDEIM